MIKITTKNKTQFVLKAAFDEKGLNKDVIKKVNTITEFISKREAVIFLGKKADFNKDTLISAAKLLAKTKRDLQIDVKTFITKNVNEAEVVTAITENYIYINGEVYTLKTKKKEEPSNINLINVTANGKKIFVTAKKETEVRNWARSFQVMPPNKLNSVNYADTLKKEFTKIKNVSVKVLNKKQIEELKMGLLLGVNRGSEYDARVVVLEYKGDPSSKEKTVLVGKGIMFDAGGYSIKTGKFMQGMKYDMSGTAIVAGAMKLIADNKPKQNISVVMPLTDNMIGTKAQTVDSVQTSMNGMTVEVNNTDAEGRLVLADAITYSVRKLKATRIIDVATLTGAILVALGHTYVGAWATDDKDWAKFAKAADAKGESVWRMPLHNDFIKYMKGSKIADLKNTDYTGMGGSITAAMFLKEFTEGVPYIHLDVAGTADVNDESTGVMIKTLAEFVNG